MFQTLDVMISFCMVFLILSMVLKYWMSLIKRVLKIRAKAIAKMMEQFVGETTTRVLIPYLNEKVYNKTLLHTMNHEECLYQLSKDQLKEITKHINSLLTHPAEKIAEALQLDIQKLDVDAYIKKLKGYTRNLEIRIETSYDKTMEKIAEIYESRMRIYTLISGILLALVMNVDFFEIYTSLSKDFLIRDRLAAKAEAIQVRMDQFSVQIAEQEETEIENIQKFIAETQASRDKLAEAIETAGIEFGWNEQSFASWCREDGILNIHEIFKKILGILISGFLISFGAPFWHELLGSVTGLKSVLKGTKIRQQQEEV